MKRIIEVDEVNGFEAMLGELVIILSGVYHYAGTVSGVNDDHVELSDAQLVYETGPWSANKWKVVEDLPSPWRVMFQFIESWGPGK